MDLRIVKNKIGSVKNITEITAALETFSALKMRKTQKQFNATKPFSHGIANTFKRLEKALIKSESKFLREREVKKILVCVVASDRGFCGTFNSNVLKFADKEIKQIREEYGKRVGIEIMPIGKKAIKFFEGKEGIRYKYFGIGDYWKYSQVRDISSFLIDSFLDDEYQRVYIIYTRFISSFLQKPSKIDLFPLQRSVIKDFMEEGDGDEEEVEVDHLLEPDPQRILDETIREFISYLIYQYVLSANTAEHSARMMAMRNASDNATELLRELKLEYNKARQAQITNEVCEVSSTKEAME